MTQLQNTSQPTEAELALYEKLIKRQNTKRFNKSKSGLIRASIAVIFLSCISFACSYVQATAIASQVLDKEMGVK